MGVSARDSTIAQRRRWGRGTPGTRREAGRPPHPGTAARGHQPDPYSQPRRSQRTSGKPRVKGSTPPGRSSATMGGKGGSNFPQLVPQPRLLEDLRPLLLLSGSEIMDSRTNRTIQRAFQLGDWTRHTKNKSQTGLEQPRPTRRASHGACGNENAQKWGKREQ